MSGKKRQTHIFDAQGGGFGVSCRICPKGARRQDAEKFERVPVVFEDRDAAILYGNRHRASDFHRRQVRLASNTTPGKEERMLDRIFGSEPRKRCANCQLYHKPGISCELALEIQEDEDMA